MLPKITHAELPEFIKLSVATRENLLIVGAPGIGKTVGVEQFAKDNGFDVVLSHPAVEDPTDIKGFPAKSTRIVEPDLDDMLNGTSDSYTQDIATFLPFGQMLQIMEATKPTIWFLDDLGQAPASVQAAYMQFLGSRKLAGKVIPDCVHIVAATNGREHKANVKGLLEPVKSRFGIIVELIADLDSFREFWFRKQLPHVVMDFLNYTPNALHDFDTNLGMENSPCPRLWEKLGKYLPNISDWQSPFAEKVTSACTGERYGRPFSAFLRIYTRLPKFADIIADADNYPLDQTLDIRYAMLGMLANQAKEQHAKAVFTFVLRCAKEYQHVFMKTLAGMRSPLIKSAPARKWVAENAGTFTAAFSKNED